MYVGHFTITVERIRISGQPSDRARALRYVERGGYEIVKESEVGGRMVIVAERGLSDGDPATAGQQEG